MFHFIYPLQWVKRNLFITEVLENKSLEKIDFPATGNRCFQNADSFSFLFFSRNLEDVVELWTSLTTHRCRGSLFEISLSEICRALCESRWSLWSQFGQKKINIAERRKENIMTFVCITTNQCALSDAQQVRQEHLMWKAFTCRCRWGQTLPSYYWNQVESLLTPIELQKPVICCLSDLIPC